MSKTFQGGDPYAAWAGAEKRLQNATDTIFELRAELAALKAERDSYRRDLARAISLIDEQIDFSVADKFAETTLFETWQEIQAALHAAEVTK